MLETLRKAIKIKEIRKRLYYTFFMMVVVRLGCQIAIPFLNGDIFNQIFKPQSATGATKDVLNFFNMFTGGSMEKMSIFALNITPYITSSIIMQLLTIAIPKLDEIQKDGEEGRKKIAEITRYLTVGLAIIESTAMLIGFNNSGYLIPDGFKAIPAWGVIVLGVLAMTAGSAVLMWIGEQITEKGIGNGISIVLTINIIQGMPATIGNLYTQYWSPYIKAVQSGKKTTAFNESIGFVLLATAIITAVIILLVSLVVILQGATRKIGVQMSQKVQGRRQVGGQQSSIPLRVNTAGVIPVIFASSLMQFPVVIATFLSGGKTPEWSNYLTQSRWLKAPWHYSIGFIVYLLLIIFFAYFYTSITFNPREVAKNLNDRGGFIPGIRSGKPTVEYLTHILNYIILIGAIGLCIVSIIPIAGGSISGVQLGFGGTSIIIIVGVILETLETLKSMVSEHNYSTVRGIF